MSSLDQLADVGVLEACLDGLELGDLGSDPSLPLVLVLFLKLLLLLLLEYDEFEECLLSFGTFDGVVRVFPKEFIDGNFT